MAPPVTSVMPSPLSLLPILLTPLLSLRCPRTQWRPVWEFQRHGFTALCLCVYWFSACEAALCSLSDQLFVVVLAVCDDGLGDVHCMHTHQAARRCALHSADSIHSVAK